MNDEVIGTPRMAPIINTPEFLGFYHLVTSQDPKKKRIVDEVFRRAWEGAWEDVAAESGKVKRFKMMNFSMFTENPT